MDQTSRAVYAHHQTLRSHCSRFSPAEAGADGGLERVLEILRGPHSELKAAVHDLRAFLAHCCNEAYLLDKGGAFHNTTTTTTTTTAASTGGRRMGDEVVVAVVVMREMVGRRIEHQVRYLQEDLRDIEAELCSAEAECLRRVLRPAGLELSLVFDRT